MAEAEGEVPSLGLKGKNRLDLASKIREGVQYERVHRFQQASHLPESRIAEVTGIPARTWNRRKQAGRFSPEESDRIARIARLFDHAKRILGSSEAARRWLEEPNLALGREVPLDVAATELGAQEVDALLTRLEHGVYS